MTEPILLSIQVGRPQSMGHDGAAEESGKPWTSAIFKEPIPGPAWLGRTNLDGDDQADKRNHGGPDKAVNVMPSEHHAHWQVALGLPEVRFGAFGENLTTRGLLENEACIGDVYAIGDARVQLSQPRVPCWKLARRWRVEDFPEQVLQAGRTGWYFRVLREAAIASGMPVRLLERPHPEWSVTRANEVMHHRKADFDAARALAACEALAEAWRASLRKRLER